MKSDDKHCEAVAEEAAQSDTRAQLLEHRYYSLLMTVASVADEMAKLKDEPIRRDVYERLGAGDCVADIWKLHLATEDWRYAIGFSRNDCQERVFTFRPKDVLDMPKLVQLLATFFADDGCLDESLRRDLDRLAKALTAFLETWNGNAKAVRDADCPIASIDAILDYLWDDEVNHFRSLDAAGQNGHIFRHLAAVHGWLRNEASDAESYVASITSVERGDHFGVCPECRQNDGYLNIGRCHWFICHAHGMKWRAGDNLFPSWKSETQEVWRRNAERIRQYRVVEPIYPQPRDSDSTD